MFSISANSLPTIRTYQAAYDFWDTAKIQDSQFRALNSKRKADTSKRVWSPDEGKTIRFRYHHTDMVEYAADTLTITFWDSVSSVIFASELTPFGIRIYSHRGNMCVNEMFPKLSSLVFHLENSQWVVDPDTVQPQHRVVVDRKISAQVGRQLRPFLKYREARAALAGVRLPTGDAMPHHWLSNHVLTGINDETRWPLLFDQARHVSARSLHRALVACEGGVSKVPLLIGQLPTKSVYDGL